MPNDTALHKSCHNGDLDAVQRMIEGKEFDVNEGMSLYLLGVRVD